jgi:RNA polymerase sigma-70 factor (ECF subfamily)
MKNQHLMERPCETPAYVSLVPGVRLRSRLQTQTISLTSSDVLQDAAAMRELYELTYARLFGMVMRIVGRREAAEDVLQEALIAIWRFAPDYRQSIAAPMTWMHVVVRSRVLDYMRARKAHGADAEIAWNEMLDDTLPADAPEPSEQVLLWQNIHQLDICMRELEENQRRAVALAYFCEFSHSEVVTEMNAPLGTVKTWIRRGVEKLRNEMQALEGSPSMTSSAAASRHGRRANGPE